MNTQPLIVNTGPLVALAVVDQLDILSELFREVCIPQAVHREILQGGAIAAGVTAYGRASWINVKPLQAPPDPLLATILDVGEAAVIQLAREQEVKWVLIDERKARRVARTIYGLKVIGTARLLVEAKREGIVETVGPLLAAMRENGYWLHDDIVTTALEHAGEA